MGVRTGSLRLPRRCAAPPTICFENIYAKPDPEVPVPHSGRLRHTGKVLFEQYWLDEDVTRQAARLELALGARLFGVPVSLS